MNIRLHLYAVIWLTSSAAPVWAASPSRQGAPPHAVFPEQLEQASLGTGYVSAQSQVIFQQRPLRVGPDGLVVFGIDRAAPQFIELTICNADHSKQRMHIKVIARHWPIQAIHGVPPQFVTPPPALAERMAREQRLIESARQRDEERRDFFSPFIWPVKGPISGLFGAIRSYNGVAGAPHSGLDIAAPTGTLVMAPAGGHVTLAEPHLYLTGGTIIIDHGYGISSNFLHLSRLLVQAGDFVKQGQVIGAVGATGRATGPHLHWGMSWFTTRIDPLAVIQHPVCERAEALRRVKEDAQLRALRCDPPTEPH